jgi:hypothetical protein
MAIRWWTEFHNHRGHAIYSAGPPTCPAAGHAAPDRASSEASEASCPPIVRNRGGDAPA